MTVGGTDVLCLGETMAAVTPAGAARLEEATGLILNAAGAESNVAMCLAALGQRAAWVSLLGDDPLGRRVLTLVGAAGVDVSRVSVVAGAPTGVMFKDPEPGASTVYYYRSSSAASGMGVGTVPALLSVAPRIVHLTGITPALSSSCAELVRRIVIERDLGAATVSFDVNFRPGLWPAAVAAPLLLELARAADMVFVGHDEARTLWGTTSADEVRAELPRVPVLVVKDAGVGATEFTQSAAHFEPSPRVRVVEHVGAGDSFAAGWLAGVIRGLKPARRLRLAHLAAAAALTSVADQGTLPTQSEIDRALALDDRDWSRLMLPAPTERVAGTA